MKEQEQYLIQRNFRLLSLWSNDISQKIASYERVLETTLEGVMAHLTHGKDHSKITWEPGPDRHRLIHRPSSEFVNQGRDLSNMTWEPRPDRKRWLRSPSPETEGKPIALPIHLKNFSGECHEELTEVDLATKDQSQKFLIKPDLIREFKRLCEAEGLEKVSVGKVEPDAGESNLNVLTRQSPPRIQLTYTQSDSKLGFLLKKDSSLQSQTQLTKGEHPLVPSETSEETPFARRVTGTINLQTFLDRLWRHQIYDELLLFEKQKSEEEISQSLIYHSGASGMTWRSFQELKEYGGLEPFWDTLFASKEQSTEEGSVSPPDKHFTISIPGQTFQVFTKPILFPNNEKHQWILVGLVQEEKFLNSSLAISSTLLLGMMFLLFGLVLAIPLFHLKTMGPTDPLRPIHVLGLILSALLGAGLVTFLILDISIYFNGKAELKDRMSESAQSIKDKMFGELKSVLETLTAFDSNRYLKDDFQAIQSTETLEVGRRPVLLEENINLNNLKQSDRVGQQDPYTDFLYAFWMDPAGSMRINWARDEFQMKPVHGMTQNFSLHQRNYVRSVIDSHDHLWQFTNEPDLPSFFLQPIISWTTGLNTVVASMKSRLQNPKGENWVAAIEFKFKSLMDEIVLPPGIGFAIIDNADKQVLFHSEDWRNLREPFLVETDHNPMLRDFLSANAAGHAEGSYWGKPHSFFLLPLDPIPWSLVVFRDMEILRSINLVGLVIAGFLYSLWASSIYVALWIFLRRQKRHRRAPWLWPDINKRWIFQKLCIANAILYVMLMVIIIALCDYPLAQMILAWIVPFAWVVFSVGGFLKQEPPDQKQENSKTGKSTDWLSQWPYPQSYSLMLTSFLLILGVAPAFGCFSAVFNQEMKLFTQFQMLELAKDLLASKKSSPYLAHLKQKETSEEKINRESDALYPGIYPEFYSKVTPYFKSTDADRWKNELKNRKERTIFQKAFALISQPFSPLVKQASLLGFIADTRPDTQKAESPESIPPILWNLEGPQVTLQYLLTEHTKSVRELKILSFATDIPLIPWFFKPALPTFKNSSNETIVAYVIWGVLFIVGLYFYLYRIPKFIADRVLFLSYNTPTPFMPPSLFAGTAKKMKHNRFVVGFPGQGKTSLALENYEEHNQPHGEETEAPAEPTNKTKQSPRVHEGNPQTASPYFDLNAFPSEKWKEELSKQISDLKIEDDQDFHVTIDHLEHQWKDPAINLKKLELMEWLLNRANHKKGISKSSPDKDSSESSQNSKLGDLAIQILTKIVSQEKS